MQFSSSISNLANFTDTGVFTHYQEDSRASRNQVISTLAQSVIANHTDPTLFSDDYLPHMPRLIQGDMATAPRSPLPSPPRSPAVERGMAGGLTAGIGIHPFITAQKRKQLGQPVLAPPARILISPTFESVRRVAQAGLFCGVSVKSANTMGGSGIQQGLDAFLKKQSSKVNLDPTAPSTSIATNAVAASLQTIATAPASTLVTLRQVNPGKTLSEVTKNLTVKKLYAGLDGSMIRNTVLCASYFPAYEQLMEAASRQAPGTVKDHPFATSLVAGSTAGLATGVIVYPVDVTLTHVKNKAAQTAPGEAAPSFAKTLTTIAKTAPKSLFRGFSYSIPAAVGYGILHPIGRKAYDHFFPESS